MYPWTYYLEKCRAVCKPGMKILKTDCNNEAYARPQDGGIAGNIDGEVTLLEYDQKVIDDCPKKFAVDKGDIRELPYGRDFDLVIDLSTLDHIPFADVPKAIGEYARVGKDLLLIVWCGVDWLVEQTNRADFLPTNQYYFNEELVESELKKYYHIEEKDTEFYRQNNSNLVYFLCRGNIYKR
jgi:ubiquinone/menaquinone biosynthesis C-methylase UbiE